MENRRSEKNSVEKARLTFLLDPSLKQSFEVLCEAQDLDCSKVVRQLIGEVITRQEKRSCLT